MEMRLVDGRYVPDGFGGFETVTGAEETLERALYKLKARRGGFALMPELGSRLWLLHRTKPSARTAAARQYIAEALSDEPELALADVSVTELGGGELLITAGFTLADTEKTVSFEV